MRSPFWLLAGGLLTAYFIGSGAAARVIAVILEKPPPIPWGPGGSSSGTWGISPGGSGAGN